VNKMYNLKSSPQITILCISILLCMFAFILLM